MTMGIMIGAENVLLERKKILGKRNNFSSSENEHILQLFNSLHTSGKLGVRDKS